MSKRIYRLVIFIEADVDNTPEAYAKFKREIEQHFSRAYNKSEVVSDYYWKLAKRNAKLIEEDK